MRKDYIPNTNKDIDEIDFIEEYWTNVWNNEKDKKSKVSKISRKTEYKIMKPYLDLLGNNTKILDGGCGLGEWTVYFDQAGYDATGIDISSDVINKLKKYFPNISFQAVDIRKTKFSDSTFDVYFSWGVFEHFEEGLQPCIREAMRLLKSGGILFISVPSDNLRQSIYSIFKNFTKKPNEDAERFYQWRLTRSELSKELSLAGFSIEKIKFIHKRQGILRSLHHEFKLPYDWFITKALSVILTPIIPSVLIAHMLIAVARKP